MPIVISRATGELVSAPKVTQEQNDAAWEHILKAYLAAHPEVLRESEAPT